MKFTMNPSLQSCSIDMRVPGFRWGEVWDVRSDWVKRGLRFSISLWLVCMVLLSVRMTWGEFVISCMLLHGVFTLM